jgi:hypothetical protein
MFQKFEKNGYGFVVCALGVTVLSLVMSSVASGANANLSFYDDFEDGDYTGWQSDWHQSEANGSWNVIYNESHRARVQHWGTGYHSLSYDFAYASDNILSFDMQANGVTSYKSHAGGYVTISLFNKFNVALGSVSLQYRTDPGSIDAAYRIDSSLHHYSASMSEWAEFAGLGTTEQISTLNLTFSAWGQTTGETTPHGVEARRSTGTVWFDNVSVVPEPATLFLLALGGLTLLSKRK